ncbi:MAG: Fe-S cluster assembly ATPase SufC [Alphaproteobacteria bacterium]|nr:Fe-S cluster assembly ATPase SufC [Alphaproteobacteria bacterium]
MKNLLEIKNLNACVGEKQILKDFSFEIEPGKVYAIMGPNGSGKSTLSNVIAGNPVYSVTSGKMLFKGKDLSKMTPDVRANEGIFLGFQYPIEIPGISYAQFLKQALTSKMKYLGQKPLDAVAYIKRLKVRAQALGVTDEMLKRPVNVGFSGGEKKRMETLQMAFLEPDFCILDEMDSGLDVDALKIVADGVNLMREENRSFLLITHYERLLDLIEPDVIYIMVDGHIVEKGDKSLARKLEENGYADYK